MGQDAHPEGTCPVRSPLLLCPSPASCQPGTRSYWLHTASNWCQITKFITCSTWGAQSQTGPMPSVSWSVSGHTSGTALYTVHCFMWGRINSWIIPFCSQNMYHNRLKNNAVIFLNIINYIRTSAVPCSRNSGVLLNLEISGNSTENSTENSVIFQNWSKTPQKASK